MRVVHAVLDIERIHLVDDDPGRREAGQASNSDRLDLEPEISVYHGIEGVPRM